MGARSKARKRAVDVLYAADVRGESTADVLAGLVAERDAAGDALNPYVVDLVTGVDAHRERIDELLSTHAEGWSLDRMPAVDRAILRIGAYEVLWGDAVPDAVAVDEAVTLAGELSTDDSPRFVNGLLARIVQVKPHLVEVRTDGDRQGDDPDASPLRADEGVQPVDGA